MKLNYDMFSHQINQLKNCFKKNFSFWIMKKFLGTPLPSMNLQRSKFNFCHTLCCAFTLSLIIFFIFQIFSRCLKEFACFFQVSQSVLENFKNFFTCFAFKAFVMTIKEIRIIQTCTRHDSLEFKLPFFVAYSEKLRVK